MRDFSIDLVWAKIQMAITGIGGWLGYFVGGVDGLMTTLIIFMVIDYITGLMCAVADKKLSSAVGFKGICKKVLIILLVGVAHIVDLHVVGTGSALRSAVVCFYLSNEGVSLLENTAHLGLPIPEKLKDILSQLHGREEVKVDAKEDLMSWTKKNRKPSSTSCPNCPRNWSFSLVSRHTAWFTQLRHIYTRPATTKAGMSRHSMSGTASTCVINSGRTRY